MDIRTRIHQVTDEDSFPSAFVPAWVGDGPNDPSAAPEEAMANAHLIAAAPDLYEALSAALEGLQDAQDFKDGKRGIIPAFDARIAFAKAALAKARGEAQ